MCNMGDCVLKELATTSSQYFAHGCWDCVCLFVNVVASEQRIRLRDGVCRVLHVRECSAFNGHCALTMLPTHIDRWFVSYGNGFCYASTEANVIGQICLRHT